MKRVLEPLAHVPGVRRALLISHDGMPIVSLTPESSAGSNTQGTPWHDSADDSEAFAGLALGWLAEVQRVLDPMSWTVPVRLVLRAARGTLVLVVCERMVLSVELDPGMAAEELRLPTAAVLGRLERTLRSKSQPKVPAAESSEEIPGIFPGVATISIDQETTAPAPSAGPNNSTENNSTESEVA
ncbi:MAG: hypothetical protein ABGY71_07180 [bacterium]|jgi:hypothetical protein|nr:hypothetical protein [Planctomycetota bacterium]HIL52021.1 hypothetical protein [Planctomycetota bacterium]